MTQEDLNQIKQLIHHEMSLLTEAMTEQNLALFTLLMRTQANLQQYQKINESIQ